MEQVGWNLLFWPDSLALLGALHDRATSTFRDWDAAITGAYLKDFPATAESITVNAPSIEVSRSVGGPMHDYMDLDLD